MYGVALGVCITTAKGLLRIQPLNKNLDSAVNAEAIENKNLAVTMEYCTKATWAHAS